jgi:hypothetical protein
MYIYRVHPTIAPNQSRQPPPKNATLPRPPNIPLRSYAKHFYYFLPTSRIAPNNIMYSLGIWISNVFIIALLCPIASGLPTADPNINITISAPAGTSDHGDPNILCTPIKWLDILIFFLANYTAHAATVKTLPGEKPIDICFAIFLAITFPFSGVARGLDAIARRTLLYRRHSDLKTAARAGALCIVIRDENWRPDGPWLKDEPNGHRPDLPIKIKGVTKYGPSPTDLSVY